MYAHDEEGGDGGGKGNEALDATVGITKAPTVILFAGEGEVDRSRE